MKNILLIENNEATIAQISSDLNPDEYSLDIAENSLKANQTILKNLPELVICNKNIYDDEGTDILSRLREESYISSIPFIFIIDNTTIRKTKKAVSNGFDFYIKKPFTKTELLKIIDLSFSKYDTVQKKSEQKLNELRGSISFSLPHEFFTPLNGILGFSDILTREFDSLKRNEILEMLQYINKDALRLKRLTENFIAFAQIEMMGKDPDKVEALRKSYFINPKEVLLTSARKISRDYLREDDLTLEIEDTFVRISEGYLKKAIGEIIDNAFKFSEKGTSVIVSSRKNDTSAMITVSDNGRGMSQEQIASIGAYMQFDRKLHEQQGSGLGLIIAKKITELHSGEFNIQSSAQDGTRINLIFDN
jgi:signal transduction histidine kinase